MKTNNLEVRAQEKNVIHGDARKGKVSKLYHVWLSMNERCYNIMNVAYLRYGGRGITVCEEWKSNFSNFKKFVEEELGPKPTENHTLDRIRNNEGYKPDNLRWASRKEQAENRRSSLQIYYNGKTQCLMQWATELGIPYHTLKRRIRVYGWTVERAFNKR